MEKGVEDPDSRIIRVVITGPECTGKSTLASQLAKHYNSVYVPEYARDYIEGLGRPYEFSDVKHIAEVQLKQAHDVYNRAKGFVFFDTYLIITKMWFEIVYGHYPGWIDEELALKTMDLYLLCDTGIPWKSDPVRENGGEMREKLYLSYMNELEKQKCNYAVIGGTGLQRLKVAIQAVNRVKADLTY